MPGEEWSQEWRQPVLQAFPPDGSRGTRHSRGPGIVPENVWGDSFRSETGTLRDGLLNDLIEDVSHTIAGQHSFAGIRKRSVVGNAVDLRKPRTEDPCGIRPERDLAILSTFSKEMHRSARTENDGAPFERCHLR